VLFVLLLFVLLLFVLLLLPFVAVTGGLLFVSSALFVQPMKAQLKSANAAIAMIVRLIILSFSLMMK